MIPRILFLDHVGVLGGGELCLLDLARQAGSGCRVLLLADGSFRERLEQSQVSVEVLPLPDPVKSISRTGGIRSDLQAIPALWQTALQVAQRADPFELIYANSQKSLLIAVIAGKLTGKPVIWHLHDLLISDHFSLWHRRIPVQLANWGVSQVIANSQATATAFIQAGGRANKVRVLYNGIDPDPFAQVSRASVDELRQILNLTSKPIVGVFSRLAPWKGQHILLQALPQLPGVQALLVGDALFGETDYAASLHSLAESLGIRERVHFLGFRADIPVLMQLCDVIVHTSVAPEPFGRVIVEGMMARKPVIATDAGAAPEILTPGITGILVPPSDPLALSSALHQMLTQPMTNLGEAGYQAACERFSLDRIREEWEELVSLR